LNAALNPPARKAPEPADRIPPEDGSNPGHI